MMILSNLVLHLVIWVDNDAILPTQNTKFRVGKLKSRVGGKWKKIVTIAPIPFLPTLFRKRAGEHVCAYMKLCQPYGYTVPGLGHVCHAVL